jgi:hypothetical protein
MSLIPTKVVGGRTYLHADSLPVLTQRRGARGERPSAWLGSTGTCISILVRIDDAGPCISLLHYPEFAEDPFPSLRESWLVDLDRSTVSYRTYAESFNPPILHRKELLLPLDDLRREVYAALTATAESIGLFDEPKRIGYRRQWLALVREKGYRIEGHALLPLGNEEADLAAVDEQDRAIPVGRHQGNSLRLVRYGFSAPVQSLARCGFLDGATGFSTTAVVAATMCEGCAKTV